MNKYLITIIMAFIIIVPVAGATNILSSDEAEAQTQTNTFYDFTHTVIAEYGTMTTCPYCVTAASQLYNIFNSGDLDFYYVSLVWDTGNINVRDRLKELGVTGVPDVYFDGGYRNVGSAQTTEQPYRDAITQCGEREVPDIDVDVDVIWKGSGILKITVTVENNDPEEFSGHLRVYIVEKESRWNDNGGNPYHYAALDIPIDRGLAVVSQSQPKPLGDTYTFKRTWFGFLHGFGDITQENTMVIAAVFDKDSDYAVQTAVAEPTAEGFQFIFSERPMILLFQLLKEHGILSRLLNLG